MDKNDVKACLRALLSSTTISYTLNSLLSEFKSTEGCDMPTFEFSNAVSFLQSLHDTVKLFGDPHNPEICLIESKKSSHITSLVERQRSSIRQKLPHLAHRGRRIIFPCPAQYEKPPIRMQKPFWSQPPQKHKAISNRNTNENCQRDSQAQECDVVENSAQCLKLSDEKKSCESKSSLKRSSIDKSHSKESDKINSCFFEDISDDESLHLSGEDSRCVISPCHGYVNDRMKNKLRKVIKKYPDGLWCCDLPKTFYKMFNFELDFREFGYTSLIRMLSELPDIFRCVRPGLEDWILFDASVPPSSKEKMMMMESHTKQEIPKEIENNLEKLMSFCCENFCDLEIEMDEILILYKEMFGNSLNVEALGFASLKSFLDAFDGIVLKIFERDNIFFVKPMSKPSDAVKWEEALPPITVDNDIFYELFPSDVVGPDESLNELDLTKHIALGQLVEVCVAEVWSPAKFFLQLYEFKDLLNKFMDDLQNFYNLYLKKYKMPDATIRAEQICASLYSPDSESPEEWHRAKILKVVNDRSVSISLVDYGTVTRVKKSQLRFLNKDFLQFPVQAFEAKLSGVSPLGEDTRWTVPVSKKFLDLVRVPFLEAEMVEADFKKPLVSVILYDRIEKPAININKKLIIEKLARACDILMKSDSSQTTEDCSMKISSFLEKNEKNASFEFEAVSDLSLCVSDEKVEQEILENSSKSVSESECSLLVANSTTDTGKPTPPQKTETTTKVNSLPPGLEVASPSLEFNQLQYYLLEQQQEENRKKINLLAIELLATNLSLKEIAMTNPELALKAATRIAENCIKSNSFSVVNALSSLSTDFSGSLLLNNSVQEHSTILPPVKEKESVKECPSEEESEIVESLKIGQKVIHVVTVDDKKYFCADEIITSFTVITSREIADKILQVKKFDPQYKILKKKNDQKIFTALKRWDLLDLSKKKKKKSYYLLGVENVVAYLQTLGCFTQTYSAHFNNFLKIYKEEKNQKSNC